MSRTGLSLENVRVLVLEDDYFLATDLEDALAAKGGIVLGPFPDMAGAARALATERPDCALVDINLGNGISFDLPRELARRSIPFAFVTGYDRAVIPDEFADMRRMEKPAAAGKVIELVEGLLAAEPV